MIVLAWARPHCEPKLHAIIEIDDSFVTACRGRWSRTDNGEIFHGASCVQEPKCEACREAVGAPKPAPYVAPPWDLSDVDETAPFIREEQFQQLKPAFADRPWSDWPGLIELEAGELVAFEMCDLGGEG